MPLSKKSNAGSTRFPNTDVTTDRTNSGGKPSEVAVPPLKIPSAMSIGNDSTPVLTNLNEQTKFTSAGERLAKIAAGLLMYRMRKHQLEIFLIHPGGPYYQCRDAGCWSIPKGECNPDEDLFLCAQREFEEETGIKPPKGKYIPLGALRQLNGKIVHIWAFRKNDNLKGFKSNTFHMEWPPGAHVEQEFPEADKGEYFGVAAACLKIHPSQEFFIYRLVDLLGLKPNGMSDKAF